jgi:hypothetical protein
MAAAPDKETATKTVLSWTLAPRSSRRWTFTGSWSD